MHMCVYVVRACMRACVRACMHACVHACVRACVHACTHVVMRLHINNILVIFECCITSHLLQKVEFFNDENVIW